MLFNETLLEKNTIVNEKHYHGKIQSTFVLDVIEDSFPPAFSNPPFYGIVTTVLQPALEEEEEEEDRGSNCKWHDSESGEKRGAIQDHGCQEGILMPFWGGKCIFSDFVYK